MKFSVTHVGFDATVVRHSIRRSLSVRAKSLQLLCSSPRASSSEGGRVLDCTINLLWRHSFASCRLLLFACRNRCKRKVPERMKTANPARVAATMIPAFGRGSGVLITSEPDVGRLDVGASIEWAGVRVRIGAMDVGALSLTQWPSLQ